MDVCNERKDLYSFVEFLAHRDSQQKTRSFDVEEGKAVEGSTGKVSIAHRCLRS